MSTISFCLTVGVLITSSVWCNDGSPPPLPHTGVQLYGGYNRTSYPNNSMIPAKYFYDVDINKDGFNDALWCQSARNESNIGIWYYPNGSQVSAVDDSSPLHAVHMSGQIGLYRDNGINNIEGIYTCVISNEYNVNRALLIALYKMDTYIASKGPRVNEAIFSSLLSNRDIHPQKFLISFIVKNGTATSINCTINDTFIYPNITQIILSYQLPTKILVELLFQSSDEGWYNCFVSNSRVEDEHYNNMNQAYPGNISKYIKVAGKPTNVTAKWICSSNDVLVTWSPPIDNDPLIAGYEVFYDIGNGSRYGGGETIYTYVIISGLCSAHNYSIFVVAYSNEECTLPSKWSDVVMLIPVDDITQSSVNEVTSSVNKILINQIKSSSINEITSLLINQIKSSSINEITSILINQIKSSSINEITSLLINGVTKTVDPTSNSQPNNFSCGENSQVSSSWPIIGVGVLLFTNIITVFMFITSCLCLLRLKRKHEEIDIMKSDRKYTGQYLSSRESTIIESEIYDNNQRLADNSNEDTDKYASHTYAVLEIINKENVSKHVQSSQNILPPIYSLATAIEKTDNETTVTLSGSNVNENNESSPL